VHRYGTQLTQLFTDGGHNYSQRGETIIPKLLTIQTYISTVLTSLCHVHCVIHPESRILGTVSRNSRLPPSLRDDAWEWGAFTWGRLVVGRLHLGAPSLGGAFTWGRLHMMTQGAAQQSGRQMGMTAAPPFSPDSSLDFIPFSRA